MNRLAVILPEGLHELYSSHRTDDHIVHDSPDTTVRHYLGKESIVGIALIFGFLTMMLIENAGCAGQGAHLHGHGHGHKHDDMRQQHRTVPQNSNMMGSFPSADDLSDLGLSGTEDASDSEAIKLTSDREERAHQAIVSGHGSKFDDANHPQRVKRRATVTVGLLVHAAADGFALGAAQAAQSKGHVQFVVFFAIMMHKMPAAFALTVFLRSSRQNLSGIRQSLFLFSSAAPVGAVIVFTLLHPSLLGLGSMNNTSVGGVLLFSAGSFLYVALVHAFQELPKGSKGDLQKPHLLAFVFGTILPCVLAAGHHH